MAGTIVVGVDQSEASVEALRWAVEEARLRRASVVAVHAWDVPAAALMPPDLAPTPPVVDIAALTEEFDDAAERLVRHMVIDVLGGDTSVDVEPLAVEGEATEVLVDTARERRATMLVVGSRGHGGLAGLLLGSVSAHVAQHAPCPVLIHREEPGDA